MATIKEIAEAAGVSLSTVDRVLHKKGRYSEKTAIKVNKLVKEMGYTPNIHARGLKKSSKHFFSVVLPYSEQDGGYWGQILDGVLQGQEELTSLGTDLNIYQFDRYSDKSCKQAFEKAFADSSIAILTTPVRPTEVKPLLDSQKIPYLFIDSDLDDMDNKITYIGQDSKKSGILSAKLMSILIKHIDNPEILIIKPVGEHLSSRLEGFESRITETFKNVNIITKDSSYFLPCNFKKLESIPDGIFVANSFVYTVAEVLKKKGDRYKNITLIGYDIIKEKENLVLDGTIDFIITQKPTEQGYRGIITLYDSLILKKDIEPKIILPMNIITEENIDTFL